MMVARTPEYLTKKIEGREVKLAALALLAHPLFILGGVAVFAATSLGRDTIQDPGSHGFSEIVYEFGSAAANNGSGFEGLGDDTVAWNVATGTVMLLARFIPIIAPLAIAGFLAAKKSSPETSGTSRTDTPPFGVVLPARAAWSARSCSCRSRSSARSPSTWRRGSSARREPQTSLPRPPTVAMLEAVAQREPSGENEGRDAGANRRAALGSHALDARLRPRLRL